METESFTDEQRITSELLAMMGDGLEMDSVLNSAVLMLKEYLGVDAIGIRVMDKAGNIPYHSYEGYSEEFMSREGALCIRRESCVCTDITKGDYDSSLPLYTRYGSFFTNELQSLDVVRGGMKTGRFRGECLLVGWESLAVVPIRFSHRYYGVIHAVAKEKGCFPPERVRFLENIAGQLALFMHDRESSVQKENEFSSLMQRIIHDLRNPLGNMSMFAELVEAEEAEKLSAQSVDLLHRISSNADYMDQLISGLTAFSWTFGPSEAEKTPIDLSAFIHGLLKDMGISDAVGLKVEVQEGLPTVMYPKVCLRRILTNLISNAAKFSAGSPNPTIGIGCHEKERYYQMYVSDNGLGINEGELDSVFDPFYRTEDAKGIPGSGLGLSIARKTVERNGGNIWVYSDKGKGSTFYFTLPK